MLVWMISQVLSIISVLSWLIFPYTHWKRMILRNDPRLSTVEHIRCIFCMFVRMIWTVLSKMNVLYYFTHVPIHNENEWSYPVINFYQQYVTWDVNIGCLNEWSLQSFQAEMCCPGSHVHIHLENEWSYLPIDVYKHYGLLSVYIGCLYEWSHTFCQL